MSGEGLGTAFPGLNPGLTLLDYFAAHAPAEPQPWFGPRMPERPEMPDRKTWLEDNGEPETFEQDLTTLADWSSDPCYDLPDHLQGFQTAWNDACKNMQAWVDERGKQRVVQWPYAWATEQMALRKALGYDA